MNKASKAILLSLTSLAAAAAAQAQEISARVISSTPVVQQVNTPRQSCVNETVPGQKSGAGALLGGIAGGAAGNAVGNGSGRAAATILGIFGGAILGDRIEGGGAPQTVQRCSTQNVLESRVVAYNVVYEHAGRQYSAQMPQDPGPTIILQVTPVGAVNPGTPAPAPQNLPQAQVPPQVQYAEQPVYGAAPQVVYEAPPQVVYAAPPVYRVHPITSITFSGGGYRHHGHHGGHGQYVQPAPVYRGHPPGAYVQPAPPRGPQMYKPAQRWQ